MRRVRRLRKYSLTAVIAVIACIFGVSFLFQGCIPKTHINDVVPEMQESELFIYRTGNMLEALEKSRDVAFESVIKLYKSDKMNTADFNTAVKASESYDLAYESAVAALSGYANASRRGESVTMATVDAAIAAVQSALRKLQECE